MNFWILQISVAVILFGVNVGNSSEKIRIHGRGSKKILEYLITARKNNLLSRYVG